MTTIILIELLGLLTYVKTFYVYLDDPIVKAEIDKFIGLIIEEIDKKKGR